MPTIQSNGLQLAYEEHGSASAPAIIMVQGLGMPLSAWPADIIEGLVAQGYRVVVFDNRDIGQSQLLRELRVPNMAMQTLRRRFGLRVQAPYQLTDMMRDVVGLMDALGIVSAHLVGVSMGGMISQLLAIHEPQRVQTLTSIMSSTSSPSLPGPSKAVRRHIVRGPDAATDEARVAFQWQLWRLLGGSGHYQSDAELSDFLGRNFARGVTAAGVARHTLAILAAPSRVAELGKINTPTLVIHGAADPLIPVECGVATAQAIPGAQMVIIDGMGHDLPNSLATRLTGLISDHVQANERTAVA